MGYTNVVMDGPIMLGVYDTYIGEINTGDSAELKAYLKINEQPVTADQIMGVNFTVQTPSVTTTVAAQFTLPVTSFTVGSTEGLQAPGVIYVANILGEPQVLSYTGIADDGITITGVSGGSSGSIIGLSANVVFVTTTQVSGAVNNDGAGFLRWTQTGMLGEYVAQCQFKLVTGELRSVMVSFTVVDPFNPVPPSEIDMIVEQVWLRLEDVFDSNEGGPWLRDMTKAHFDSTKIAAFIPEALLDINVQMPPTNFGIDLFTSAPDATMNPNQPLLVKGVLVLVIRHLMRSYTEIFTPTGQGQLVWPDRTRYQQAWGQIYQIEYQDYIAAVRLWKRTLYGFGHSALLTFSKAGRLFPYGTMSTRGIYRGYGG
jgi:hypothetical protein